MDNDELEYLLPHASPKQAEGLRLIAQYGSAAAAEKATGVKRSTLTAYLCKARKSAAGPTKEPEHHNDRAPEDYILTGVSTHRRNSRGDWQWVKTKLNREQRQQMLDTFWNVFAKELPQVQPSVLQTSDSDLMSVYPISDTHLGMLAWHGDAGEDADLGIITSLTTKAIHHLSAGAPQGPAALEILGDFLHFDSVSPVTTRSGNLLDSDSRYSKVFETALRLIRQLIEVLLSQHESLEVIISSGNHDELSARHLAICLTHIYERDNRVFVNPSHAMFHFLEWGKVGIMIHHGDKTKMAKMAEVFAASDTWRRTTHRFVHSGHWHQDQAKDWGSCLVESFRVIIPPDSYAAGHGYGITGRELRRIDYHKEHGRYSTQYVNPGMLK